MKLNDLSRGIAYTVTEGVLDGTLAEGDVVAICSDGCLLLMSAGGWLDTNDPADIKYIEGCEFEVNKEYYLVETQTSAKFASIPYDCRRFPWDDQLDAIAMASQEDFHFGGQR